MKKKIRIAFVLPDLRGGGAEGVFVKLAKYFTGKHSVFFFVGKNRGVNICRVESSITIVELGNTSGLRSVMSIVTSSKKYGIDLLVGTLGMAHAVSLAKLFLKSRCVCVARLGTTISAEKDLIRSRLKCYLYIWYQKVLALADNIVVQSNYMMEDARKVLPASADISLIHNPVVFPPQKKERLKRKLHNNDSFKFAFVGRLAEEKDPVTALKAFEILLGEKKNVELHFFGTGELEEGLKKYVERIKAGHAVFFNGYQKDIYFHLSNMNALVLSSKYEGFSNVLLEALSIGIPIVATDSPGGNRDVLVHGYNAYLAPVGDAVELYKGLEHVLSQPMTYDFDSSKYSIETIGAKYLGLYYAKKNCAF